MKKPMARKWADVERDRKLKMVDNAIFIMGGVIFCFAFAMGIAGVLA